MTKTLETMLEALTVGGRLQPEKSHALPAYRYGNPERSASFKRRETGEDMQRLSDKEIADSLLIEWYRWSKAWRPHLGAPRIAPWAREYRQDEKHNDESDGYEAAHKKEMEAVAYCLSAIAVSMQQAIGSEMRNREVKQKVWRSPSNHSFTEALSAVYPLMKKHPDLCALFN